MRKFLTLCAILLSLSASAQWQLTGSRVRYVNGLGIPTRDTSAMTPADSSQILIRPADSSLYVRYKRAWQKVGAGGGGISGSGTTNYVPKFTSSTAIGNSQIFDDGTNVGIGTTTPGQKLDVLGDSRVTGQMHVGVGSNYSGSFINESDVTKSLTISADPSNSAANSFMRFNLDGTERMRIISGGNVGIDYTAPAAKLAVNGTALINTNTDNGVDRLQVSGNVEIRGQTGNVTTPTYLKLDQSYSLTPAFNKLKIYFYVDAVESYGYGVGSNSDLQYWAGSSTTGMHRFYTKQTEAVRITANQSILVNTTTDNNVDKLQVNGSIQGTGFNQAYTARTTTYTATTSDYFIDCTSGTFTVNLFTAVGNTGRILIIKNSGTGTITVDPNGSQTIDGATTQSLATQWSRVHIISDGANWKIISN
jgi:hypothetical protein